MLMSGLSWFSHSIISLKRICVVVDFKFDDKYPILAIFIGLNIIFYNANHFISSLELIYLSLIMLIYVKFL